MNKHSEWTEKALCFSMRRPHTVATLSSFIAREPLWIRDSVSLEETSGWMHIVSLTVHLGFCKWHLKFDLSYIVIGIINMNVLTQPSYYLPWKTSGQTCPCQVAVSACTTLKNPFRFIFSKIHSSCRVSAFLVFDELRTERKDNYLGTK